MKRDTDLPNDPEFTSPDTSYVFVKIGLGFHAEMTMDEASVFIDKMEVHLNAYVRDRSIFYRP